MKLKGNTILITGGSEGVGLAMAQALAEDNTVIICGRTPQKLQRAQQHCPALHVIPCDITCAEQRQALVATLMRHWPALNVLINNAGAKQYTDLRGNNAMAQEQDMALNFTAPVDLCSALLAQLQTQPDAAIVNISTGLIYLPKAEQAFYCAAKAALHSYNQSLRWALKGSSLLVCEVVLPLINTKFHHGKLPTNIKAISATQAANQALRGIGKGRTEVHVGKALLARWLALFAPSIGMAIVNKTALTVDAKSMT